MTKKGSKSWRKQGLGWQERRLGWQKRGLGRRKQRLAILVVLGLVMQLIGATVVAKTALAEETVSVSPIETINMSTNYHHSMAGFSKLLLNTGRLTVVYNYLRGERKPTRVVFAGYDPEKVTEAQADEKARLLGETNDTSWTVFYKNVVFDTPLGKSTIASFGLVTASSLEKNRSDILYYALEFKDSSDETMAPEWIKGKLDYRSCAHAQAVEEQRQASAYSINFAPAIACKVTVDEKTNQFVFTATDSVTNSELENDEDYEVMTWKQEKQLLLAPKRLNEAENAVAGLKTWWQDWQERMEQGDFEEELWMLMTGGKGDREEWEKLSLQERVEKYEAKQLQWWQEQLQAAKDKIALYELTAEYADFFADLETQVAAVGLEIEESNQVVVQEGTSGTSGADSSETEGTDSLFPAPEVIIVTKVITVTKPAETEKVDETDRTDADNGAENLDKTGTDTANEAEDRQEMGEADRDKTNEGKIDGVVNAIGETTNKNDDATGEMANSGDDTAGTIGETTGEEEGRNSSTTSDDRGESISTQLVEVPILGGAAEERSRLVPIIVLITGVALIEAGVIVSLKRGTRRTKTPVLK